MLFIHMRISIALWICCVTLVTAYMLPSPSSKGPAITPLRAQGKYDDLFQYKDMSGLAAWLRTLGMSTFSFMGVILAFSSPLFAPACASNGVPELYNSYASSYNILNGGKSAEALGINELRVKAGAVAMGDVLEVAVGTGLELDYLNLRGEGNTIKSVVGIDISTGMLSEAAKRVQAALNTPVVNSAHQAAADGCGCYVLPRQQI